MFNIGVILKLDFQLKFTQIYLESIRSKDSVYVVHRPEYVLNKIWKKSIDLLTPELA